ncbi:MAG: hypothetical protein GF398_06890 [Chitinivibrionales bacterium]|nr:hypothetical protein [Chitinivibrionales bacterium]
MNLKLQLPRLVQTLLLTAFALSAKTWTVDINSPHASDTGPGESDRPFASLNAAAAQAQAGDTVLVQPGIYYERVAPHAGGKPDTPIVYRAAIKHRSIVRGTEIWRPQWQRIDKHIYRGILDTGLFVRTHPHFKLRSFNPYTTRLSTGLRNLTLGQVYVDDRQLREVDNHRDLIHFPGTWKVSTDSAALEIHFPHDKAHPDKLRVEIAVRARIFAPYVRGLGYLTVRGFVFERCANQYPSSFWNPNGFPQAGAVGCRAGHHWIIQDNIIRSARNVGLDIGNEGDVDFDRLNQPRPSLSGYHIVRNNNIECNGSAGIVGAGSPGSLIIGNRIEDNNYNGIYGSEGAAIKLHHFNDGLIEGNLIRNNGVAGIWLDNRWSHSRVTRNVILNNTGAGIFIELGRGPLLIDHNVIATTRAGANLAGDGIYSHDALRVKLTNNLIYANANFGVWSHIGSDRLDGATNVTGWHIQSNIICSNHRGALSFPIGDTTGSSNYCDYNLYAGPFDLVSSETWGMELAPPLFLRNTNKGLITVNPSPQRIALESWRAQTGFDRHSRYPAVLRPHLSIHPPTFEFMIDTLARSLQRPRDTLLDYDFYGSPLGSTCIPGPVQDLIVEPRLHDRDSLAHAFRGDYVKLKSSRDNTNHLILWPIAQTNRRDKLAAWQQSQYLDTHQPEKKLPESFVAPNAPGSPETPARIAFTRKEFAIDGKLGEWEGVQPLPAPYSQLESGSVKLLWSREGLWGAAEITDSKVFGAAERPYRTDALFTYIEKDNAKSPRLTRFAAEYTFTPDTAIGNDRCGLRTFSHNDDDEHPELRGYWQKSSRGYTLELFIPAEILQPARMKKNTLLGFNYSVYNEGKGVEHFSIDRRFDRAYRKPYYWGTIKLAR